MLGAPAAAAIPFYTIIASIFVKYDGKLSWVQGWARSLRCYFVVNVVMNND